ncbi:hypothetical protein SPOG_03565 [Schizosaccharomyces cryophilus OY26]|uniref:Uncharacterized protein n=1 Tax=Schizosaccharomyces cryophilus (strain OY26 / ATCC MYA-4695 / CBS 11777 / NBRC 106824 / NRRL Y48691) TaxID=653667 RepID=S9X8D5_SCHCR|nr:uncharacterized protein SPOG_03565 [Schizosaccharomyces cryophilus OY26]EPY50096.1 hypothetical protein SPOG_03565 [Schizosaccharomyces cryophilus OY26]
MFFFVFAGFALVALVVTIVTMIHSYFLKRRQKAAGQAKPTPRGRATETGNMPNRSPGSPLQTDTVPGFPAPPSVHYYATYRHPQTRTTTTVTEDQPDEVPPPYTAAIRENVSETSDHTQSPRGQEETTSRNRHERPRSPPPVYLPPEEMV